MTERIIIMTLLLFATSCEWNQFADKIYYNGNIWTGNVNRPNAEFIAVKGETILSVGSNYKPFLGPETELIDLHGQFVVPGFIDNHTHFIEGGFQLMRLKLRDVKHKDEFIRQVKDFVQGIPAGQWVQGGGWDHEMWGSELPTKEWIDSFTEEIPVFLNRLDGHMGLANSKALELAGITRETPDPPGGLIKHDERGNPTGILREKAERLVIDVIPPANEAEMDAALEKAMDYAASIGVTQVHDMCKWNGFETYVRNKEKLSLRIYALPRFTHFNTLLDYKRQHGTGDGWLRWYGVKVILDGSLGSRTAWMHKPYKDDPNTTGLIVSSDTLELKKIIRTADEEGFQIAIHAIGTKANEWVLDEFNAIEKEHGKRDRRSRIEHSQHLLPKDMTRFSKNGITASMQPIHLFDDGAWAHKRVDDDVLQGAYVYKSLLESGANVTFGSDWPVASLDPLMGIYTAVTRHTRDGKNPNGWYPDEKITVEEAIRSYTINSAYAGFQEDKLGTIEAGKLADFVVLSKNITAIAPKEILTTKVIRTVVGGKDVFVSLE